MFKVGDIVRNTRDLSYRDGDNKTLPRILDKNSLFIVTWQRAESGYIRISLLPTVLDVGWGSSQHFELANV
jgi:hypothetical protein